MGLGYWKSSTGVCFYSGYWILEEAKTGAVAGFFMEGNKVVGLEYWKRLR